MRPSLAMLVWLVACGTVDESQSDGTPAGDGATGADGRVDGAPGVDGSGADGGAGVDATRVSATVASAAALDGYVRQDLTASNGVEYLNVGDRSDGQAVYAFVSFETAVPVGATITAATLTVYQEMVTGTPYGTTNLGALRVQHVDYGDTLDGADYALTGEPATSLVVASNANAEVGAQPADVLTIVGPCVGVARCQFRLRFARDTEDPASDGAFDYVTLSAGEHTVETQRPTLSLSWDMP